MTLGRLLGRGLSFIFIDNFPYTGLSIVASIGLFFAPQPTMNFGRMQILVTVVFVVEMIAKIADRIDDPQEDISQPTEQTTQQTVNEEYNKDQFN